MASSNPCAPRAPWAAAWGSGWATCCSACSAAGATMERPRFPRGWSDEPPRGTNQERPAGLGQDRPTSAITCQGGWDDERDEWIGLPWADDGLSDRGLPA